MRKKHKAGSLNPVLESLAAKYGVNEAAVLLRWCQQKGVVAVTAAGSRERMVRYLGCLNVELSEDEVLKITEVGATKYFRGNNGCTCMVIARNRSSEPESIAREPHNSQESIPYCSRALYH